MLTFVQKLRLSFILSLERFGMSTCLPTSFTVHKDSMTLSFCLTRSIFDYTNRLKQKNVVEEC